MNDIKDVTLDELRELIKTQVEDKEFMINITLDKNEGADFINEQKY